MDQDWTTVGLKFQPGVESWFGFDLVVLQGLLVEETQDLSDTLGKNVTVEDKIRWGNWRVANYEAILLSRSDLTMV